MSSFNCPECNLPQIDTPLGYTTGCAHYTPDWRAVNKTFSDYLRVRKVLKELYTTDGFVPDPLIEEIEKILNDDV
jgi:hypothetical protein